jgi:hypothetical protein
VCAGYCRTLHHGYGATFRIGKFSVIRAVPMCQLFLFLNLSRLRQGKPRSPKARDSTVYTIYREFASLRFPCSFFLSYSSFCSLGGDDMEYAYDFIIAHFMYYEVTIYCVCTVIFIIHESLLLQWQQRSGGLAHSVRS